jgi:diguanylate cyclase (GGDEF)-like protein
MPTSPMYGGELLSDRPWVRRVLRAPVATNAFGGIVSVSVQLVVCLTLSWFLGGTDDAAPHWYYLPIAFAALRFGVLGAFATALAAAVLAGPLTAADVGAGTVQPAGDQISQLVAFVIVGVVVALTVERPVQATRREVSGQRMASRVQAAIANGAMTVEYQPLWHIDDDRRRMTGAEALVRWVDPGEGTMAPGNFIPLLEEADQLDELGAWVLDTACRHLACWIGSDPPAAPPFHVAVNVSSVQLSDTFVATVAATLERHAVDPDRLVLELTERTMLADRALAVPLLTKIRALGVQVAIDDFGTGFSSLAYLRNLDFDIVKLDRAFIGALGSSRPVDATAERAIVGAMIDLAQELGKAVIVEGVESGEQLEALRILGATNFQGSFLADPSPASVIASHLGGLGDELVDATHSYDEYPRRRAARIMEWARHKATEWAQPRPRTPAMLYPAQIILVGMFYAGALLTLAVVALNDVEHQGWGYILGITALVAARVVDHYRGRIAEWMLHVLLVAGLAVIIAVVAVDPVPTTMVASSAFLIWVAIYAGVFFNPPAAVAHGVLAATAFGLTLHFNPVANDAAVWIIMMGTAGVAGLVAGWLARQLRTLAATDALTGLPNRQALEARLESEIDRARRSNTPLAVAMVDLNDFKSINDRQGHHAGDRVLEAVPAQWQPELRAHDVLARYGGDEFIVLLPDCPLDDAEDVLLRMSRAGNPGCSIGVVTLAWGEQPEAVVARADAALYEAKLQHVAVRADRSVPSDAAVGGRARQPSSTGV